jgi:hypothetical protein
MNEVRPLVVPCLVNVACGAPPNGLIKSTEAHSRLVLQRRYIARVFGAPGVKGPSYRRHEVRSVRGEAGRRVPFVPLEQTEAGQEATERLSHVDGRRMFGAPPGFPLVELDGKASDQGINHRWRQGVDPARGPGSVLRPTRRKQRIQAGFGFYVERARERTFGSVGNPVVGELTLFARDRPRRWRRL